MKIKYKHFPYPVLADFINDFKDGSFNSQIEINTNNDHYNFKVEFDLNDNDLERYLEREELGFAIHIECPFTSYRKLKISDKDLLDFNISADLLEGKVEVVSLVISKKNIKNYFSDNFSDFFKDFSFDVYKGDILGVGEQLNFNAEKESDSIKNISSIFAVEASEESDPSALDVDLGGNKIIIYLEEEYFEKFKRLNKNQNLNSVFASLIVTPVLVEIIEKFKNDGGEKIRESEKYRWFRILNKKIKDIGIDLKKSEDIEESSISIAQKLINRHLERAFDDIEIKEQMIEDFNSDYR
jgi:hypothetical protein